MLERYKSFSNGYLWVKYFNFDLTIQYLNLIFNFNISAFFLQRGFIIFIIRTLRISFTKIIKI